MASSSEPSLDPVTLLAAAWREAVSLGCGPDELQSFMARVRAILDEVPITRAWNDDDLPDPVNSPYERRGPLGLVRPWRTAFFRLMTGGLLLSTMKRGEIPLGRRYWLETFPGQAYRNTETNPEAEPPIAPSLHRPPHHPFAYAEEYRHWMLNEFPVRVGKWLPAYLHDMASQPYVPEDRAVFARYAHILATASVILLADKLGLGEEASAEEAEAWAFEWLDPSIRDPFQFRYRGANQLWPDLKYVYVDLWLQPLHAQVLTYEAADWDAPRVLRSLPLWEANTRTVGDKVVHTGLRRIDLELAVWSETMLRRLAALPTEPVREPSARPPEPSTLLGPWEALPRRIRDIAQHLHEATSTLANSLAASSRFIPTGALSNVDMCEALAAMPVVDRISLIPPGLTTPVLEDDQLRINLDWEWVAPDAGWMELKLLVLTREEGRLVCGTLDYEEDSDTDGPLCLNLEGEFWAELRQTHGDDRLCMAFGQIWFGRRNSGLDSGAVVVGLINLSGTT